MASVIYPKAKEAMWQGAVNAASGNVKAYLIDTNDYTYDAADEFLSDITGIVGTSANLASKTFTDGVFDAADTSFATATGDPSEAIIVAIDTGTPSTSRLLVYIDSGTGLPVTPNGGDINVAWDSGANKIAKL